MKNFLLLLFLLFTLQTANSQTFNSNLASKLQSTLDSLVATFTNTKGVSASVYYPGQGIWKGASGVSYADHPITTDMEFGLASNSKLFTAVLILKLVEANILNLDDSLNEWLPTYSNVNPNITIRQLLNHTSGVSDPFFTTALLDSVESNPTHFYTPTEILAWLGPPYFNPGTSYGYSNINYILAGMVVESSTGIHVAQLIRDSILTPLQLDSTFFDVEETILGTIAHRWYNNVDFHDTSRISLNTSGGPAGALFSTASEVVQWYHALMSGQVLSPSSFAEMTTFATPGNYGLGLGLFSFFGNTCWGHGGSTNGYKSRMVYDPCSGAVVSGLSNSFPSAVDGITVLLYKVLLDYLPACGGTISGPTTVCQGQNSVTYAVTPITNSTSYVWTLPTGATGTSVTNSITINYGTSAVSSNISVKGINAYGEGASSKLAIIVNAKPATPIITMNGNLLHSNSPTGNQWYDQIGLLLGATNQDYAVSSNGNYYVIVTQSGCSSNPSNTINVLLTGTEEFEQYQTFNVYPNPVSDVLNIEIKGNKNWLKFEIFDIIGKKMYEGKLLDKTSIPIHNFSPAVYLIKIENGLSFEFKKIVIE